MSLSLIYLRSPGGFEADIRQVDGEIENLDNKLAKLRAKVPSIAD